MPTVPSADASTEGPRRLGVDIWLDVACPWCLVGERRFDKVLKDLPFKEDVDVRFHSFQLDPNAPERSTMTQPEYLASRGMDPEKLRAAQEHLQNMGSELGIHFDEASAVPSNTFTAHRLIQAAAGAGVQAQVVDALFSAYFEQGKDVGDPEQLRAVVLAAGLPQDLTDAVLADPEAFRAEVSEDISQASRLGISGVPFYVIDNRYGVSGAQPEEVFSQALTQVFDELNPQPKLAPLGGAVGQDGETCGPNGC
ncbi:DsbA family oxidoreductase [Galactobacter caseinivorans]|nr:DsbA family oxidoreductase [Galactobacter caseinivorans]